MRRTTIAALALTLAALGAGPAAAHGDSTYRGDCGYRLVAQEAVTGGDNHYVGVVSSDVVAYSPSDGNIVGATVTCTIEVDGVLVASASGTGYGAVLFAERVEFDIDDTDVVHLCWTVDFTTDDTPTAADCARATTLECCPFITDPIVEAFNLASAAVGEYVDPTACAALAELAPGVGPVTVDDEGDVFVSGEPMWDCPPYDIWDPPADFDEPRPGGGWNDGRAGFLAVSQRSGTDAAAAACAFAATGTGIHVVGSGTGTVRCRLEDTATGTVLYDRTVSGPLADTAPAFAGNVTVCVEGTADSVTTGLHCRYGVPVG